MIAGRAVVIGMVGTSTVGVPDFDFGIGERRVAHGAIKDVARDFNDWSLQTGGIQISILEFRHAGHPIGTFDGFNRQATG